MAGSLTPAERIERQRTDHRLMAALDRADCPIRVSGHRTAEQARSGEAPVSVGDPTPPAHYRVVYDFDTLSGPGRRYRPTVIHIAPLASGDYPALPPGAWVVGEVIPWTPHFAANVAVCHGAHVWIPNRTQVVDYAIHLGKLLNFDEPPPVPGYHGYNRQAVAYWRSTMALRPLDPELRFPQIRAEDVSSADLAAPGVAPAPGRFGRAEPSTSSGGRFRAADAALVVGGRFSAAGQER
jgi:hypothetical protein